MKKQIETPHIEGVLADVNLNMVDRIALVCAKRDVRYYLEGVAIQPHPLGAAVIGTDGHRMIVGIDKKGKCTESMIIGVARSSFKKIGESDRMLVTEAPFQDSHYLALHRSDLTKQIIATQLAPRIVGKFPDWQKVICPEQIAASTKMFLNPAYLADMTKALSFGKYNGVRVWSSRASDTAEEGSGSIYMMPGGSQPDGVEMIGLVMPMRDIATAKLPEWAYMGNGKKAAAEPERKAA